MNFTENVRIAFRSLRANRLRSSLTVVIIAIGITALIATFTAADGMDKKVETSFSDFGSNTFSIRSEGGVHRRGGARRNRKAQNPPLTIQQINQFKRDFRYPATVSASCMATSAGIVVYKSKKTNPNVSIFGVDGNYLKVSGYNIAEGRNFSTTETSNGSDVALIGPDVIGKVFEPTDTVVGSVIAIGSRKYKVIGILTSKGASKVATDNQIMIPLENSRYSFPSETPGYSISVMVENTNELDLAIAEATGTLRGIRHLRITDEDDFSISKADRLTGQVLDITGKIEMAVVFIAILTLLGAGVGLMNIMLVSVNERTREIGISKAIGATRRAIIGQFLTEAVVICQLGGIAGIIVGVLLGNLVGLLLETGFSFPVFWVIVGIASTFVIGLLAGVYPAYKAGDLNPVEALRYE